MDVKQMGYIDVGWIKFDQDRIQCRVWSVRFLMRERIKLMALPHRTDKPDIAYDTNICGKYTQTECAKMGGVARYLLSFQSK